MKRLSGLLAVLCLMLFGCKTPCTDPSAPPMRIAVAVESQWECQNHQAVEHDIQTWFASHNMCQQPQGDRGIIANLICPLAGEGIRQWAAGKVPASWQCNPAKIGANAEAALVGLCELLPF